MHAWRKHLVTTTANGAGEGRFSQFLRSYARPSKGGTNSNNSEPLRPPRPDAELRSFFQEWVKEHSKKYKSGEEMEFRYQVFKDTAMVVDRNNWRGYATVQDLNNYADYTTDELYALIAPGSADPRLE